jgi:hypothetical protein
VTIGLDRSINRSLFPDRALTHRPGSRPHGRPTSTVRPATVARMPLPVIEAKFLALGTARPQPWTPAVITMFDKATGSALDLFRAGRVASPAQRVMLISRDGGCTKPCCTVGPCGSQVHHAAKDWHNGGQTNVDELGLACGPDNRMVGDGAGSPASQSRPSRMDTAPQLDTGRVRVDYYQRPNDSSIRTKTTPERVLFVPGRFGDVRR